jgi:RNA polymerase sigma factor (sigma-70 family)
VVEEEQPDDEAPHDDLSRFQAVYEAHYQAVFAYTRRRAADVTDAQDAVAETFTIAWRRLADVPEAGAALPWLYGVARRVMANQRRSNRRRADLTTRLGDPEPVTVEFERELVADEERRTVLAALGRLPDGDQELLRLAVWEGLPHRDIAQVVGCSEGSVAVRLHRARNRLGREIEKEMGRIGHEHQRSPGRRAEGQA